MSTFITEDGTEIYFKDWGEGRPVVFSHGWPLSSDSWEDQMFFLAEHGFRAIGHDRRGHGRSSQPFRGNDMDTYADDLALVGFSTGGGEVARCVGRHGTARIAKVALVSAVPPLMLRTPRNPAGTPKEVFDGMRAASLANRSQFYLDIARGPFFGFNRPDAVASEGLIESFWRMGMQAGLKNTYDCIAALSETDFSADLQRIDVPTLVIHGDDDQVVPIDAAGRASARLVARSKLLVYPGAPHGLTATHKDRVNQDLLQFLRG
jgi:non-heme chloroperoxidase